MENYKRRNKVLVVISTLILIVLALLISKVTYSFLEPIDPDDVRINSEITATGDTLLFTKGTDIEVTLTQANFNSTSGNLVRSVTPQVKLIASNKTNNATANYYVSVNISENTFQYTNGTSNPEILLSVIDNDGNPLTSCTGLTYKTVGGVSGFDITNKMGVYDFAEQTISTTSSTTGTTKNWTYTVTFINKTTDQSINEDATINIQAVLHKETEDFCELNPDNNGCRLTLTYNPSVSKNVITLDNGYIYYHDEDLTNGAGDGSWRYAGANPNNYVCFGSFLENCPADNIYRIIGLIPVDVVTNSSTNPPTTERQMLYKLIKNDYETESSLGMTRAGTADKVSSFGGPSGNQPSGTVDAFYYYGTNSSGGSTWSQSTLNTVGLNTNVLQNMGNVWSNRIANVMWKVGGNVGSNYILSNPTMAYQYEIVNSGIKPVGYTGRWYESSDGNTEIPNKIGLMYVSDYGYSRLQSNWRDSLGSSNESIFSNNWLYKGVDEWLITRRRDLSPFAYRIFNNTGTVGSQACTSTWKYAVRRTFYLTDDTEIDTTNHAGTITDPYRVL